MLLEPRLDAHLANGNDIVDRRIVDMNPTLNCGGYSNSSFKYQYQLRAARIASQALRLVLSATRQRDRRAAFAPPMRDASRY
jgi:hypothetical protein